MALTPDIYTSPEMAELQAEAIEQQVEAPKRSWRLDFANGRISEQITDLDALLQYVHKALITPRSRYLIYTDDYGCELPDLIGDDVTRGYLDSEVPRMVREALVYHEYINDVTDITYEIDGDKLRISFSIDTIYGEARSEVLL